MPALVHQNDFAGIDCHYDTYRVFLENYIREEAAVSTTKVFLDHMVS